MTSSTIKGLIREFFRFVGVGMIMLVYSITTFYFAFEVFDLPLYSTYTILYLIAIFVSYLLNSKFTFNKKMSVKVGAKYYLAYLIGLALGLALLRLSQELFDTTKFFHTLIILIPRTLLTYLIVKVFVFKNSIV